MALEISRRRAITGGTVVATSTWLAPSVLRLDRAGAAVGSCGVPPVQVDWSDYTNTFPNSVTAADGTVVTITVTDPDGVGDLGFLGLVLGGTISTLDNPMIMAMENATNGDLTRIQFDFSSPVDLCFDLLDVDRNGGGWEDTMEMTGSLGGVAVPLGAGDIATGPANDFIGANTIRGNSPVPNNLATANATITYPSAVDQVIVEHRDDSTFTGFQFIGIHDLRWC